MLLLLGMFWNADMWECVVCSEEDAQNCPEEMCTADLHESALPHTWQCDP